MAVSYEQLFCSSPWHWVTCDMRALLKTSKNFEEQTGHNQKKHKNKRTAAPLPTKNPQETESRTGLQMALKRHEYNSQHGNASEAKAGQQLSRNSHGSLVRSNIGSKGRGAKLTWLSLDTYKTVSSLQEKVWNFHWRTQTADISPTRLGCKSPELKEGVRVTGHSSTSCPHQLDVITATLLPSAATALDSCFSVSSACSNHVSRSFNQMRLFWWRFTVLPVSPNSSPVCYLLAADNFSIFHHHNICDVETNSLSDN